AQHPSRWHHRWREQRFPVTARRSGGLAGSINSISGKAEMEGGCPIHHDRGQFVPPKQIPYGYTKRDQRALDAAEATTEGANTRDAPSLFRCSVCGVEMSDTVTIMALSEALGTMFYCAKHLPKKWR